MSTSKVGVIPSRVKWERELNSQIDWKGIYTLNYKCTSDTKLLDFQYRVLNRILTTNVSLVKFGIQDSDKCTFCLRDRETIFHMLAQCNNVKTLWTELALWLNESLNVRNPIVFSERVIILGSENPNYELVNCIIVITKQYIYRSKFIEQRMSIEALKHIIKYRFKIEKKYSCKKQYNGSVL